VLHSCIIGDAMTAVINNNIIVNLLIVRFTVGVNSVTLIVNRLVIFIFPTASCTLMRLRLTIIRLLVILHNEFTIINIPFQLQTILTIA